MTLGYTPAQIRVHVSLEYAPFGIQRDARAEWVGPGAYALVSGQLLPDDTDIGSIITCFPPLRLVVVRIHAAGELGDERLYVVERQ